MNNMTFQENEFLQEMYKQHEIDKLYRKKDINTYYNMDGISTFNSR
jgi:hypothetical protein